MSLIPLDSDKICTVYIYYFSLCICISDEDIRRVISHVNTDDSQCEDAIINLYNVLKLCFYTPIIALRHFILWLDPFSNFIDVMIESDIVSKLLTVVCFQASNISLRMAASQLLDAVTVDYKSIKWCQGPLVQFLDRLLTASIVCYLPCLLFMQEIVHN